MAYDLQICGLLSKDLTRVSQAVLCECKAMAQEEWNGHVALWQQVRAATFAVFCCSCLSLRFFPALMSFTLTPLSIPPQPHTRASSICHKLSEAFGKSRALLRDVGVAANVPIEPELQTKLIDATMQVWGLGFGFYDLLFICLMF
jgi:hypothetical protein